MKNKIIFTLLLITQIGFGQIKTNYLEENILTNQLLIQGKTIEDIEATSGDNSKMISLFGNGLIRTIESSLEGFILIYQTDGLKFVFAKSNDTDSIFYLNYIKVISSEIDIQFKGKNVSVDKSIDILADSSKSYYENEYFINYKIDSPINMGLLINYNKTSNNILSIEFSQELDN
ncbi:hypothetical protein BTO06_12800 [Tenacibaculum sp. SZ-18]|uniref:hypothetical protein n=1 Tax=Tenacibaculum sp. SZ-18 TaxID=754423 RepID=UPI000C2D0FAE|nr:hypothetical protein [Tenacibaculum sp. SZ-18]AUC15978.1 hypothetical protein BTO06_12800 [Tenacibaculum sp. SZ-18]